VLAWYIDLKEQRQNQGRGHLGPLTNFLAALSAQKWREGDPLRHQVFKVLANGVDEPSDHSFLLNLFVYF
jgi:hypothetical protein